MAGYRPKSLDELNSIYGKTMEAEKAIRKGSSLLESEELSSPTEKEIDAIKQKEKELLAALENYYNIGSSSVANAPVDAEASQAQPMPEKDADEEESEEAISFPQEEVTEPEIQKPIISQVIDSPEADRPHEVPSFKPDEKAVDIIPSEEEASEPEEEAAVIEEEAPVVHSEPIITTSRSDLMDDYMKIMQDEDDDEPVREKKLSRKEKKKLKKQQEAERAAAEKAAAENEAPAPEEKEAEPSDEAQQSFAIDPTPEPTENFSLSEAEDITVNFEEEGDFSFPEDYEPEWIEKDKASDIEESDNGNEETKQKKTGKGSALLTSLLCLLLAVIVALGALATAFKSILAVNTGTAFLDNYYLFTSYKDYENANILEGDLVITERAYAQDGDIFAYINYNDKIFEFAKRTKSISNGDEVLIVAENEGERALVSRDDCRGVVFATYTGIGKYIALATDNYIAVMAVLIAVGIVLCIILISSLKSNSSSEKKALKKSKKAEEVSDDSEEEDIFSTIG